MNLNNQAFELCMLSIFIHDYAYPKPIKTGIMGLGVSIPRRPQDIQLYNRLTIEFARESTPEQLGAFIKEMLLKIDKTKEILEQ